MKRRIIAAVAAVILAGVAAFGLFTYVQGADARAMAGQETVEVLVVTKAVPKGTTPEGLTKSVESKLLPQTAVAPGAVTQPGRDRRAAWSPRPTSSWASRCSPAVRRSGDRWSM